MQRREFSLNAMGLLGLASSLPAVSHAQARKFEEGSDYLTLDKPVPVEAPPGKVEVIEFFWYSCPHCNAFEPALESWVKRLPADVSFKRVPIAFRDSFAPQQRLYYALEAMGLVDKLHAKVFAAIHAEKKNLSGADAIVEWVSQQGVDKAQFVQQFNSFTVATKITKATQLQNAYKVEGVPALGVAGRFYTDGSMAGNMQRALQVVEALATDVRAGR